MEPNFETEIIKNSKIIKVVNFQSLISNNNKSNTPSNSPPELLNIFSNINNEDLILISNF